MLTSNKVRRLFHRHYQTVVQQCQKADRLDGKSDGRQYESRPCCRFGLGPFSSANQRYHYPSMIADFGCGGGRNTAELLKRFPSATVTALDYSIVACNKTKQFNRYAVSTGRCQVIQGDVSRVPFASETFDIIAQFQLLHQPSFLGTRWPGCSFHPQPSLSYL